MGGVRLGGSPQFGNWHCKLLYEQFNAFKRVIISDPTTPFVAVVQKHIYKLSRVKGGRGRRGKKKGKQREGGIARRWKT